MTWLVIVGAALLAVLVIAWFTLTSRHPEDADRHAEDRPYVDERGRGTRSKGVMDRPAGPDAEDMSPDP